MGWPNVNEFPIVRGCYREPKLIVCATAAENQAQFPMFANFYLGRVHKGHGQNEVFQVFCDVGGGQVIVKGIGLCAIRRDQGEFFSIFQAPLFFIGDERVNQGLLRLSRCGGI